MASTSIIIAIIAALIAFFMFGGLYTAAAIMIGWCIGKAVK